MTAQPLPDHPIVYCRICDAELYAYEAIIVEDDPTYTFCVDCLEVYLDSCSTYNARYIIGQLNGGTV